MKKIFSFLLCACLCATYSVAQDVRLTMLNWDGSPIEDGCLYLAVGETRTFRYSVEPANTDVSTLRLATEYREEDNEAGAPVVHNNKDLTVTAYRTGTRYLYVYLNDVTVAYMPVVAYNASGSLNNLNYSLNEKGQLSFGKVIAEGATGGAFNIPNFATPEDAPWYEWRALIKEILLNNVDSVGNYAFNGLTNLHFVQFPENVKYLGDSVFFGCTYLQTLIVERFSSTNMPVITNTAGTSLVLEDGGNGARRPGVVIVNHQNTSAKDQYNREKYEWSLCGSVVAQGGAVAGATDVDYALNPADSLGNLQLSLSFGGSTEAAIIGDRGQETVYPWDGLSEQIDELQIGDYVSYIGAGAFENLYDVQEIQFNQTNHPLDSIHWQAFSMECMPWKFALGDPQDGPIIPPTIVGLDKIPSDELQYLGMQFSESTVLYVPDSTFVYQGKTVKAIDLYKAAPFWSAFNVITDRTVEVDEEEGKMIFRWYPLENAQGYRLSFHKDGCATCDTTFFIPASGPQGLIDWTSFEPLTVPNGIAARRTPKSDDNSGGMTLTISIKSGSGSAPNDPVEAEVSGMESKADYIFVREVPGNEKMNKSGEFKAPETATGVELVNDANDIMMIYDILGRRMGNSLDALQDGIYIIDKGNTRTTILLRR